MSDRDLVWYGRAGVWIGVSLLLLMAFTGAQVAIVTVLAVLGTITGAILLIYTIPFGAQTRIVSPVETEVTDRE